MYERVSCSLSSREVFFPKSYAHPLSIRHTFRATCPWGNASLRNYNQSEHDEVDESKYGSNNKLIQNLVFYKPSKSRAFRAEVLTNEEKSGEKANAKTSVFNKKATMMPGV